MANPTASTLGWKKVAIYSLLPLALTITVLEGSARLYEIFFPPLPMDYGWGFDKNSRLFVADTVSGGMVTNPRKTETSFREQRFAMPKPTDTFRIFVLGGSNVNLFTVHQQRIADTLSGVSPTYPNVEVINCGGNGYGSQRLRLIAIELMDYEPDLLMIYSGHNEFNEEAQLKFVDVRTVPLQRVLFASAFGRLVRDRIAYWNISIIQRERNAAVLSPDIGYAWDLPLEERRARMIAYEENLSAIAGLCQANGVAVVLGTVASNLFAPGVPPQQQDLRERLDSLYASGRYEEGLAFVNSFLPDLDRRQASSVENDAIRRVAAKFDIPVADVYSAIAAAEPHGVPGETLFGDHCHLLNDGMIILAQVYAETIRPMLVRAASEPDVQSTQSEIGTVE